MGRLSKIIDIIGVRTDFGASCQGADAGAKAIRIGGLVDAVRELGYNVRDCKDICIDAENKPDTDIPSKNVKNLNNIAYVNEINAKLYKRMSDTITQGHFPIVLGGDHSLAAASVMAVQKHFDKIGLVWVDAHGDFNTAESSPSGNIHGMPLSALTGNGSSLILPFKEAGTKFIDAKNTVIIAARALDGEEKKRIREAGITVFSMADIDSMGILSVMQKAVEIASNGTSGVYLSFDIDSVDPFVAPGVGTPVSGGLTYREAHFLCEYLAANSNLLGCEIVELNPYLDNKNQTAEFAVGLITSLLGKTII